MYWHPPDPNVVRVHASLAVAQSVTLGHCGKQPAHTNFKLVFSWICVTKAKLKMVFVFTSLTSFYNTILCFHQQKQTNASRKYNGLTQVSAIYTVRIYAWIYICGNSMWHWCECHTDGDAGRRIVCDDWMDTHVPQDPDNGIRQLWKLVKLKAWY